MKYTIFNVFCISLNSNELLIYKSKFFIIMRKLIILLFCMIASYHLMAQQSNNSLSFDGIDDYVLLPSNTDFNFTGSSSLSVTAWIHPHTSRAPIFSKWRSANGTLQISFNIISNKLHLGLDVYNGTGGQSITSLGLVPTNIWTHVAFTLGSGIVKIYINGIYDSSLTLDASHLNAFASSGITTIGGNGLFVDYGHLKMDEFTIWNKVLSVDEINKCARMEVSGSESGLLAYYNFNQGQALSDNSEVITSNDQSTKRLDAELKNFALSGTISNWVEGKSRRYYVATTESGLGNGSSWDNASSDLAKTLEAAAGGDSVWVAAGTYKPTPDSDRTIAFNIKDGVKIFGGFAGNESSINDRNFTTNEAILSGDIGIENDNTDNSTSVVNLLNCSDKTELDGFTIKDAVSQAKTITINSPSSIAGEYLCEGASFGPQAFDITGDVVVADPLLAGTYLQNDVSGKIVLIQRGGSIPFATKVWFAQDAGAIGVIIFNNIAGNPSAMGGSDPNITIPSVIISLEDGLALKESLLTNVVNTTLKSTAIKGAVNLINSSAMIKNCIIKNNNLITGALHCENSSGFYVLNCSFVENTSTKNGGSMYISNSSATITNCDFINNKAVDGSAIYNINTPLVIDNCTFKNNYSTNSGPLYNSYTSLSLKNSNFEGNRAAYGSAVYNTDASIDVDNCSFENNYATSSGALYNLRSILTIKNSRFLSNSATNGGAIYNQNSNLDFLDCVLNYNQATNGGAIYNDLSSIASSSRCSFYNNSANTGGAIHSYRNLSTTNCIFDTNLSKYSGAAINFSGGSNTLLQSVFVNNISDGGEIGSGGAIQLDGYSTEVTATNCLFANNQTKATNDDGGGAVMIYRGTLNLQHSTISNNYSSTVGGAISIKDYNGSANIENSIIWGNTASIEGSDCIENTGGGTVNIEYSIVQGDTICAGTGNSNVDPLFVNITNAIGDDNVFGTVDDGFALSVGSPAINSSNPLSAIENDLIGNMRIGIYDMGAYESQITTGSPTDKQVYNLKIYPNPAKDGFYINAGEETSEVSVYDLRGSLVISDKAIGVSYIKTDFLQKGVYVVKINGRIEKLIIN